ncbi:ClpP/crotonase-like domain-containing protein [Mucidula mucida]|nr:ClpP/crotonase-like domain-containing protein [Mucidula mucida]
MSEVIVDVSEGIATITFNRPRTLNAITQADYNAFANALREIDKRPDVVVTVWQATGKWFCAGTDIKDRAVSLDGGNPTIREAYLTRVAQTNTDCGNAMYSHSKVLVAALNGPVMGCTGIAAAFLGYFDLIYCLPDAWLSVPFTFLGLVAEGGSSVSFINRMGVAKATEVLLWGRKQTTEELYRCGFVNQIFPPSSTEEFHRAVRRKVSEDIEGLDPTAVQTVKSLLRTALNERNNPDAVNLRESYAQATRFATGVPMQRFAKVASKEIKHKL